MTPLIVKKVVIECEYAEDDKDFSSDCEGVRILVDGNSIPLPFEADYPKELAEVYVLGMKYIDPDIEVEIVQVNGDW